MDGPAWGTFPREYVRRLANGDERRASETDRPLLAQAHAVLSKCRTMHEADADGRRSERRGKRLSRRAAAEIACAAEHSGAGLRFSRHQGGVRNEPRRGHTTSHH